MHAAEVSGLAKWLGTAEDGQIPHEMIDRMIAQPRFFDAVRLLMARMLDLNAGDPLQDSIRKDLGRFLCGIFVLYLDVTAELTLPGLKRICVETGLISPGRARAFLIYLRLINFVEPAPGAAGKRAGRYIPTERMAAAFRDHTRIGLEALLLIEPEAQAVLDRLDDPAVFSVIAREMGEGAINSARLRHIRPAVVWETFVPHNGGMQVLYCLYEAALEPARIEPNTEVTLSISRTSQRSGISRPQVLRLLRDAEQAGLLERIEGNVVRLAPFFLAQTADLCAINLIGRAICAARALEVLTADS